MSNSQHEINITEASQLTANYRNTYPDKPIAEYFSRDAFEALLANPAITGIRIYKGLDEQGVEHSVMVGAIQNGSSDEDDVNLIMELSKMCPPHCSSENPINS